jgi:hypothetical protein
LRRLAEGADEGEAHPLGIAKAGQLRDAFDRRARWSFAGMLFMCWRRPGCCWA